jgi:hypothetical protein
MAVHGEFLKRFLPFYKSSSRIDSSNIYYWLGTEKFSAINIELRFTTMYATRVTHAEKHQNTSFLMGNREINVKFCRKLHLHEIFSLVHHPNPINPCHEQRKWPRFLFCNIICQMCLKAWIGSISETKLLGRGMKHRKWLTTMSWMQLVCWRIQIYANYSITLLRWCNTVAVWFMLYFCSFIYCKYTLLL